MHRRRRRRGPQRAPNLGHRKKGYDGLKVERAESFPRGLANVRLSDLNFWTLPLRTLDRRQRNGGLICPEWQLNGRVRFGEAVSAHKIGLYKIEANRYEVRFANLVLGHRSRRLATDGSDRQNR